jgi:hypothetical protein
LLDGTQTDKTTCNNQENEEIGKVEKAREIANRVNNHEDADTRARNLVRNELLRLVESVVVARPFIINTLTP